MRLKYLLVLALLVLVAPGGLHAGEEANAPTATGETGLFTLLTGDTLPRGGWSFSLYYNNWDRLLDVPDILSTNDTGELSVEWHRLSSSIGYGLTDRWEVSLSLPYDSLDYDADDLLGRPDLDESGVGNARLGTKFRLMGQAGDASTVALNAFVELPTGDEEVASDDAGFGAGLSWRSGNWVLSAGYRDPGDSDRFGFSEEILAGVGYASRVSDRLDWITELVGTFTGGYDEGGYEDSIDLVYIDGAHSEPYVESDTDNALSVMAPGGAVVWDDYWRHSPGVAAVLHRRAEELDLRRVPGTRLVVHLSPGAAARLASSLA